MKLNIDKTGYKDKPKGATIAGIRNRLNNAIADLTPAQLIEHISKGRSFTPAEMTGQDGKSWKSQQIIIADIDNSEEMTDDQGNKVKDENGKVKHRLIDKPLTPGDALDVMSKYGIKPAIMYYTFSNRAEWVKFRVVLILDRPITDVKEAEDITARFTGIFNAAYPHSADPTMSDAARIIFGGKSDSVFYSECNITSLDTAQSLPQPPQSEKKPAEVQIPLTTTKTPTGANTAQYDALQAKLESDKENFNLAAYIQQTTNSRAVKRGRALFFNPCPLCGHNDDFQVTGALFHCHSASGNNEGGSIIDYLMAKEDIDLAAALDKFKYEIMRYDRAEWTRAYMKTVQPTREYYKGNTAEKPTEAATAEIPAESKGLLTLERAQAILEAVDDKYLELDSFPQLSKMAKLRTHDTVVIAADTGAGKSSLALNFLHDLQADYPALYINLEMDEATVLQRLVAIHTGEELDKIEGYKHDERTRKMVNAAITEITGRKEIRLLTDAYDIKTIEAHIQDATAGRAEPTIVFIDTGLLVTTTGKTASRYERFTEISEKLRKISRLNNVIMFVLLQQNRESKKNEKAEPKNSSLKESGSWENDATKIMFLWYNPKTKRKELAITKNRSGNTGSIELNYSPHTQTYSEVKGGFTPYDGTTPFDADSFFNGDDVKRI